MTKNLMNFALLKILREVKENNLKMELVTSKLKKVREKLLDPKTFSDKILLGNIYKEIDFYYNFIHESYSKLYDIQKEVIKIESNVEIINDHWDFIKTINVEKCENCSEYIKKLQLMN